MKKFLLCVTVGMLCFGCSQFKGDRGEPGPAGINGTNGAKRVLEGAVPSYYAVEQGYIVPAGLDFWTSSPVVDVLIYDVSLSGWIELNIYAAGINVNKFYMVNSLNDVVIYGCPGSRYKIIILG